MKRKVTFLLAALLLMSGLTWAQQITWSAADHGYENGQVIESVDFNDFVAGAFFKGTNNNAPKYYNTGAAIRCYGGNYFTITSDYVLTEIVLGFGSGDTGSNAITTDEGTYENGTWTGSANEVTFTIGGTSGHRRIASFTITYDEGGAPTPSIVASNVSIAYDATEGEIVYTINNGVEGGELSAATDAEWLEIGEVGETVPFTCSANEAAAVREGEITLTYTYGDNETVEKTVTVTQEGAPVAYTTIPELFAAATSTETGVLVNFNNWVVSGVSTNGKNVFVTDNESNGFVIYSGSDMSEIYTVGDILSGETSCTLKLYNGFAELLNVNAEDLTITEGGSITEATIAMADLTGVNTGALLHYENLTCNVSNNKYYLTDGTTTLQVYNALYAFGALTDGATYNISGIYQQYNSTKEILPRSAEDIEEVVSSEPSIEAENITLSYDATEGAIAYTINNPVDDGSITASTESEWLYVNEEAQNTAEGSFTLLCDPNTGDARTATVTLTYTYGESSVTKDVTVTQAAAPVPSITVAPATVNAPFTGKQGTLTVTYENITEVVAEVYFCNAEGEAAEYDWIIAEINAENNVEYVIEENEGEARTAYLKVYALDDNAEDVYSNLVTINQYEYVAPTYATLPFEFNGGKADIENTDGLYQQGLGSDYSSAPKLKFDGTDDYLLLQFLEEPDTLAFDIKGNSFNGGTFTVQTSVDGETYTELASYTELGSVQHDKYAINSDVRYIMWVYTEKVSGNVALGNITLSKPEAAPAVVTVAPDMVTVPYTGGTDNFTLTIENIDNGNGGSVRFFDPANPEMMLDVDPTWIVLGTNFDELTLYYEIDSVNNSYESRTACFKYIVYRNEDTPALSNLVTVTQEGKPLPTVAVDPYVTELETPDYAEGSLSIVANNLDINDYQIHYYELVENEFVLVEEAPAWLNLQVDQYSYETINYYVEANMGDARTAYFKLGLQSYPDMEYYYSEMVTISQAAYETPEPPTAGWVLTNLADLTENDMFVITGTLFEDTYAMSNDNGTSNAPAAVEVHVAEDGTHLTDEEIAENIIWNISVTENGYIFYPNGDAENWLYCISNNNGVRVGTNDANVFSLDETTGYLKHNATGRYIGIYNAQNWRCYTNTTGNIANQTFAFYKYVSGPSITVTPNMVNEDANEHDGTLALNYTNLTITSMQDFDIQYYDAEGEEAETPDWIEVLVAEQDPAVGEGYVVSYYMIENEGEARTAYFKVYAMDDETNLVYSNLVTVTQDAFVAPVASITVEPALVEATAVETEGTLTVTYENITNIYAAPYFYDAEGNETTYEWITAGMNEDNNVHYQINANEGEARTAYLQVWAFDDNYEYVASNMVTINQEAGATPVVEGWVLTDLADLMEGDVFVIVGNNGDTYAMPNDNGTTSAPAAVAITVEGDALAETPADNLQWNISVTENGYIFYPNGSTDTWLYCTNNNNGVRVGTNNNNLFVLDEITNYLLNVATSRYIGIYNSQDWRCYPYASGNIAYQSFAFYKKVVEPETYTFNITGYGESEGGYSLIASPVYVNPANVEGMTEGNFDLYWFDQAQDLEWRNYEESAFNLVPGKGYLYAHDTDVELTFTGTPYSGDGIISLVKDNDAVLSGWNLVGNPFSTTAYINRNFYVINEAGTEILPDACTGTVEAMQGVFVIAEEEGETLTFSTEAPEAVANVTLNLSQNRGAVIDRTVVRFGEGRQLPKFQLNTESTKLYIPQGNNDYAVVRSATYGEMPVNFKAQNNGTYTISIDAENMEANYLHLIDNMTGNDIDLLATPSYTFEATTNDYASRFRLVFNITGVEDNTNSTEPFAFFNGSEWVISNIGKATLQMVDLTGRILSSESISGNATVSTANLSSGIYLMRLVNGENVKTQKMVIK